MFTTNNSRLLTSIWQKSNSFPLIVFTLLLGGCGTTTTPTGATNDTPNGQTTYQNTFINPTHCDQIIDKVYLTICYDYTYKAAKSVGYTLQGGLVNEPNIDERPSFYEESAIPKEHRASSSDYTASGYDRGHLAPDASFDWSVASLESTYSLANIIPQAPTVNRYIWQKAEEYARDMAVELGSVEVMDVIRYSPIYTTIGSNHIAVSMGYYKVLSNSQSSYHECFYYPNDLSIQSDDDTLKGHLIDCAEVAY